MDNEKMIGICEARVCVGKFADRKREKSIAK